MRVCKTTPALFTGLVLAVLFLILAGCKRSGKEELLETGTAGTAGTAALIPLAGREKATARLLDPAEGGWEMEVFAAQAEAQLARLASLISGESSAWSDLGELVAEDVLTEFVDPDAGETVFESDDIRVARGAESATTSQANSRSGLASCEDALKRLQANLRAEQNNPLVKVSLKLIATNPHEDGTVQTTVLYNGKTRSASGFAQERATLNCNWLWADASSPPLIRHFKASDFESVQSKSPRVWFSDCTQAAFGKNASFGSEMGFGMHHWLQRVGRVNGMLYFQRHGIAVGDANSDGLDDVYVCQPAGLPNKLFLHQPDGTAQDASAEFGVDWLDNTASALFVDLDNDGDQDLVLATFEGTQVLENNTGRGFRPVARLASADYDLHALSAADYDGDGDLDLYVTVDFSLSPKRPFLYHDANDGGRNQLFRNDGAWRFVDATEQAGLGLNNARHSLAAAWEDYDNDGDQDLYIANDYGKNCLYRNDGGRFSEIAERAGTVDYGSGMSVSWADYDRDGWMDLYVGNMFSSAGSRITSQDNFLAKSGQPVRSLYRRFVRGNSCFRNERDGTFAEMSEKSGAMVAGWAWSSVFTDLDNDGWEDLFVANGYITTPDTGDF